MLVKKKFSELLNGHTVAECLDPVVSISGACNQSRQDKGYENSEMSGDRLDQDVLGDEVEDFCHFGLKSNSSCDKEIKTRMGKANTVFGRLLRIWKSNGFIQWM